jgi:hypothetical protein
MAIHDQPSNPIPRKAEPTNHRAVGQQIGRLNFFHRLDQPHVRMMLIAQGAVAHTGASERRIVRPPAKREDPAILAITSDVL